MLNMVRETAIGYVRRSQDDKNRKNMSIQNQDELIMQYCKDKGYNFISDPEPFYDKDGYVAKSFNEGYTSTTKCNRVILQRMVKFAIEHKITWIIIKETSRLGRVVLQIERLCQNMKIRGIDVWSINEAYNVVQDATMRGILITMDARHLEKSSQAQRAMMKDKKRKKLLFSRPPFGYKVKKMINESGQEISLGWEIEEEKAKIIRDLFDYFNEDGSYIRFAEKLGIDRITVRMWLKNKIYCGYFTYHKFTYEPIKVKDDENGNEIEIKDLHEKVRHEYKVNSSVLKPIITLATWEKAQRRFDELREKYRKK